MTIIESITPMNALLITKRESGKFFPKRRFPHHPARSLSRRRFVLCILLLSLMTIFSVKFSCLVSFDSMPVPQKTTEVFILFFFSSFLIWNINMLQSICHTVCLFHKDYNEKGHFLAYLLLWPLESPLIISPLLKNSREKHASGFSLFLGVGFHIGIL